MGKSTSPCISGQNYTRDLKQKQTNKKPQKKKKELKGKRTHKPLNKDVKHLTDFRGHVL